MQGNKIKGLFITGTDTGVGKTVITGLLGRYLSRKGYRAITQKWVQTGSNNFSIDVNTHLKLMKKKKSDIRDWSDHVSPYIFKLASSPHLASRLEKKAINTNKVKRSFDILTKLFDFVLVEGVGGALVPFNRKKLLIHIAQELDLPVLIVAANKLGAINHTLLTIEAIKKRNMNIIGVIFNNQTKKENNLILEDNPKIVKDLTGETILGSLPRTKNKDTLYRKFIPIGKKIIDIIKERKNG